MKITDKIEITNEDNINCLSRCKNESVDVICIDPPYLYLKGQKLERVFDESLFFNECKRVLKTDGFIILFGRGISFYRWNCILNDLGFVFKEEIIWNKNYGSSPLMAITRVHETISIFSKGKGKILKVKIPYLESKNNDFKSIKQDISRIKQILNNKTVFENLEKYIETKELSFDGDYNASTTITNGRKRVDRVVSTAQSIIEGMKEKTIITCVREHYDSIHPTQKPVKLIERLLNLVIPIGKEKNDVVVADFFMGSGSTMEAVYNLGLNGISCEIDKEFFNDAAERLQKHIGNHVSQQKLF